MPPLPVAGPLPWLLTVLLGPLGSAAILSVLLSSLPTLGLFCGPDSVDGSPVLLEGPWSRVVGLPVTTGAPILFRADLFAPDHPGAGALSWLLGVQSRLLPRLRTAELRVVAPAALTPIRSSVAIAPDRAMARVSQRHASTDKVFLGPPDAGCAASGVWAPEMSVYAAVVFRHLAGDTAVPDARLSVAVCFDWLVLGALPVSLLEPVFLAVALGVLCALCAPAVCRHIDAVAEGALC